jgi:hypothetical protein
MAKAGRSLVLVIIGFILGTLVTYLIQLPSWHVEHDVLGTVQNIETKLDVLPLKADAPRTQTPPRQLAVTTVLPSKTTKASDVPKAMSMEQRLTLNYSQDDLARLAVPESNKWTVRHGHYGPIVDTEHKLVFCSIPKAACTIWRQLLRRLNGAADYDTVDERITHHYGGKSSGLTYLSAYSSEQADAIMTNPAFLKVSRPSSSATLLLRLAFFVPRACCQSTSLACSGGCGTQSILAPPVRMA